MIAATARLSWRTFVASVPGEKPSDRYLHLQMRIGQLAWTQWPSPAPQRVSQSESTEHSGAFLQAAVESPLWAAS